MTRRTKKDRKAIRRGTKEGMARARDRGERISRHAHFGFRFDGEQVVPDAREQRIILWIDKKRKLGWSYRQIVGRLNATTRPRKGSKTWYAATVRDAVLFRQRPVGKTP